MRRKPPKGPKTHGSGVHNEAATHRYIQVSMNIPVNKKGVPLHPEDCVPLTEEELRKLLSSQIKSQPFNVEPKSKDHGNVTVLSDKREERNKLYLAFKEDIERFCGIIGQKEVIEALSVYGADHNVPLDKQTSSVKAEDYEEIIGLLQLRADEVLIEQGVKKEVCAKDLVQLYLWGICTVPDVVDERKVFDKIEKEVQTLYNWGSEIKQGKVRGAASGKRETPFSGMLLHSVDCDNIIQDYKSKQGHYKKKAVPVEHGGYAPPYDPQRTTPKPTGRKGVTPSGQPMADFLEGGKYDPTSVVCNLAPVLRWFINAVPSDKWPSPIRTYVVYRNGHPFIDSGKVNQAVAAGKSESIKDVVLTYAIPHMTSIERECESLFIERGYLEYALAQQTGDFTSAEEIRKELSEKLSTKSKPPEDVDTLLTELNDFKIKLAVYPDEEAFGLIVYNDKNLGRYIREGICLKQQYSNVIRLIKDIPAIMERSNKWDERRTVATDPDKPYMELQRMGARGAESTYQKSKMTHRHILNVIGEQLRPAPYGLSNPRLIVCRGDGYAPTSDKYELYTKEYMDGLFGSEEYGSKFTNLLPANDDPTCLNSRATFVEDTYMSGREKWSRDFWIKRGNADKAMYKWLTNHTNYGRRLKAMKDGIERTINVLNMDVNPISALRKVWASKTQAKKQADSNEAVRKAETWAVQAGFELPNSKR